MVKSGLEGQEDKTAVPRVSQYRLSAHLASAMVLYVLFLWSGLNHLIKPHQVCRLPVFGTFRCMGILILSTMLLSCTSVPGYRQLCDLYFE